MGESTARDRIFSLEREHHDLKQRVHRLERRAFLTPTEQLQMADLKKQKLLAKDQLAILKRDR
ncbi:MAG: YdcH family protein [Polyangiaceae bacterium]